MNGDRVVLMVALMTDGLTDLSVDH